MMLMERMDILLKGTETLTPLLPVIDKVFVFQFCTLLTLNIQL